MPLGEVIAFDRAGCDLARPAQLREAIRDARADIIVNAAAYTAVDKAEAEEEFATTVNGAAVGVIAQEARRTGALLVHYSTDYVFDGSKDSPYVEDDAPRPINAYGRSKLAGEAAIRDAGCDHIVLRASWVYAAHGHNFLRTMLKLAHEREELRVVDDQIGAPTWARDIADATASALATASHKRSDGNFVSGFFNLTASGCTSWYGFADAILDQAVRHGLLSRRPTLLPSSSAEQKRAALRPKNSRLAGDRFAEQFGITLPDWMQGVARCLEEIRAGVGQC